MAKRKIYHISSTGNGDWKVKKQGSERASNIYQNKNDAVERGRELAKKENLGQLIIHKKTGKFQTEYIYGKDPYPPKG